MGKCIEICSTEGVPLYPIECNAFAAVLISFGVLQFVTESHVDTRVS